MRFRPQLQEGWSTLFILWAMLLVASTAIMQTDLIDGLHIIPIAASVAMFLGVALAKSHFRARTAHAYAFVVGLFMLFYLVGTILPGDLLWRERVFEITTRQIDWLQKAFGGGTSRDGLIFVIQTTAVFWLLGYTAAWYTFRKTYIWRVILPTGLVLLSVVYYYNGPRPMALYLGVYVVLSLLYVSRTHLVEQEELWRHTAVRYDKGIWFSFIRAALVASLAIMLFSWALPTMSASAAVNDALSGTQGPWREFQDNWTRLFSSLRSYSGVTADPYQDSLILGGPRTVGNTLIMDVSVPRELPYVYWQAVAYDTYRNGGWYVTDDVDTRLHYPDDGLLPVPATAAREVVNQVVFNYLPNSSILYAAPEVVGTDRQMFVESTRDEQGAELISGLRSRYILRQGDRYEVASRMSTVDATSLRGAGTSYPAWVMERHLQLPDSVTARTRDLAAQLTAQYDNPFDKSLAVRDYLRDAITYNDQIDAPPTDVDPVDYTLFETQEGYCNYYASAMVVMLRSQGVPARVVSGYAQGDYEEASRSYRVRASNAHTWVEVYFPGYGWIQFEPTASIPLVERPESAGGGDAFVSPALPQPMDDIESMAGQDGFLNEGDNLQDLLNNQPEQGFAFWQDIPPWQLMGVTLTLLLAGLLLFIANRLNRRVESDIERSYQRLGSWAGFLGVLHAPGDTPYERAEQMTTAVPEGQEPIRNLTNQYVRQQFAPQHAPDEGFDSLAEWRTLRPLLIRESIAARWRRFRGRGEPPAY
jgi:transglutaminase-like putative cysteine protease